MNRIKSLGDLAKSEQRRKRIGGIVIISLLLLSTIGFAISIVGIGGNGASNPGDTQGFSYNGQYWVYSAGSQKYYFTKHVDEINISSYSLDKTLADFAGKQIYIDSEPVGLQEIYNNLGQYAGKINEACYGPCEKDLPEKDCSSDILIVVRGSLNQSIYEQESCIFIDGDIGTIDAFLYKVLGIN
ncbi:MAG: hypothetical protein AABW89_04040 [Nanoarchaeota archaeon]